MEIRSARQPGNRDIINKADQRSADRTATVFKVVRVETSEDQGLARCRNISDGGMMLDLMLPVGIGDRISIEFSPAIKLQGRVAWINSQKCGISLEEKIDHKTLLSRSARNNASSRRKQVRLEANIKVNIVRGDKKHILLARDISQNGMKIINDGSFKPGLGVVVLLNNKCERRGIVRWTMGGVAGVLLLDPLPVEMLGSLRRLENASSAE